MKGKSLSRVRLLATPWTAAYQAPPSMGFSRQEYWSGVPLPSPRSIVKHPQCACPHARRFHIHLPLFAQLSKACFIFLFLEDEVTSAQTRSMTCPRPCDLEVMELVLSSDLWVSFSMFCSPWLLEADRGTESVPGGI